MNYNEALNYIHSLLVFGSIPGLERISELLERLGNPQDYLKCIHVAGTNGKGSVCTMLSSVYKEAGLKVGLYTSPYVVDFRERIQINGNYIEKAALAKYCELVKNIGVTVTEFEFITALAFLYFKEQNCDIVILETGLGGRFDATNVIKAPLCSVITKIDYDHTAYLGDTLDKIAMEKCGIVKKDCPAVSYPLQETEAMETIRHYAENLTVPNTAKLEIISSGLFGNTFIYNNTEYKTRLIGIHQVYNAITAIEAIKVSGINVNKENIINGIANAVIPARLELIKNKPLVFLDGAHNPNGAEAVSSFLESYKNDAVIIMGMMADKNCEKFIESVLPFAKSVITVTVKENPRTIDGKELAQMAIKYCSDVSFADTYDEAITLAALKSDGVSPIFVLGSLYLAGGIREKLISYFNS